MNIMPNAPQSNPFATIKASVDQTIMAEAKTNFVVNPSRPDREFVTKNLNEVWPTSNFNPVRASTTSDILEKTFVVNQINESAITKEELHE